MVIYAMGGSEGTAVEAASRTGRRESGEKLLVKSLHLRLFPSDIAPESQSSYEYSISVYMCVCSTVHSSACNEKN